MTFEEWKAKQEQMHNDYDAENAWNAGVASRQVEIDALQRKLKLIESLRDSQFEQLQVITQQRDSAQVSNIELQKRIDSIVDLVHDQTTDYFLDNLIQDILKGDKND